MTDDLQLQKVAWFHSLPPVLPCEMAGVWRGDGIPSGHPLDGVLENLQWFGKRFRADLRSDALLFQWRPGRLVPIEPSLIPMRLAMRLAPFGRTAVAKNWFSYLQKVMRAQGPTATLMSRIVEGIETAAMVYDRKPIVDHFKRMANDEVAGMMAVEGDPRRYFFRLRRVDFGEKENGGI